MRRGGVFSKYMAEILRVKNLSKSFGANKAVDNLSFVVESGKLFAFLGQNGAGKSTTINMLIGTLACDQGEIVYGANQTFKEFKNKIGVVFQDNILDDVLTVKENLKLFGKLYAKDQQSVQARYDELAQILDFKSFENKQFHTLSGGQKRRVEIARALFNSPEILFLDEPTTGLDPKTRLDVWRIINQIRQQTGMTVFLTTHYMEETAEADEVVIIHNGQKIAEGSPAVLKEKYSSDKIRIVPKDPDKFVKLLKGYQYQQIADQYEIRSKSAMEEIDLLQKFREHIKYFEVVKGSMDDVFLNAIGEFTAGGQA